MMSEQQLKAFREAIQVDEGLKEKLRTAADIHAVVAIANAAGFLISADELERGQSEISGEDLQGVNGGNLAHVD